MTSCSHYLNFGHHHQYGFRKAHFFFHLHQPFFSRTSERLYCFTINAVRPGGQWVSSVWACFKKQYWARSVNGSVLRLPRLSAVLLVNQLAFKKVNYLLKSEASRLRLKHYQQVSLLNGVCDNSYNILIVSSRLISLDIIEQLDNRFSTLHRSSSVERIL